jgi:NAD+ synthetase
MNITIAQLNPTVGQLKENAQAILDAAQTAQAQGTHLMITPELALCGYPPKDLLLNDRFVTDMQQHLEQLALDLPPDLPVLVGTVSRNINAKIQGEKPLFNSVALLHKGSIERYFHKRLLPNYDVFDEHRYFESGNACNWFILADPCHPEQSLKIGITICEDFWNDQNFWGQRNYPLDPLEELAKEKVDLIVNLAASPYTVAKQQFREKLLAHGARRCHCPIFYANQVGGNDDLIFDGYSVLIATDGSVKSRAPGFRPYLLHTTLSEQPYPPTTPLNQVYPLPPVPEAEIWQALVFGVQDYVRKCGFQRIVLGLSGGIDSALVATIAAAAVGPANVLAVLMPSSYSSDHSITDAVALVKTLGIQSTTLPIEAMMQSFGDTLRELFTGQEPGVAEENLQSRIRGTLLMAIANKFGHLLLSTGNKSEMAVGYCTLYGDMDGGLAAIADVPKTQVYKLCQWINDQGNSSVRSQLQLPLEPTPIIPPNILTKPPSAELKPGQVDQDSLPDYDTLDAILDRFLHQHQSVPEVVAAGFDEATVQRIWTLVMRSEFKRKQAAPGLKITDRAFGTGWRMPIASQW